jgi:hypothetical protein
MYSLIFTQTLPIQYTFFKFDYILIIRILSIYVGLYTIYSLYTVYTIQGESKKTDTFVIHLNIKCISFFWLTLYTGCIKKKVIELQRAIIRELLSVWTIGFHIRKDQAFSYWMTCFSCQVEHVRGRLKMLVKIAYFHLCA